MADPKAHYILQHNEDSVWLLGPYATKADAYRGMIANDCPRADVITLPHDLAVGIGVRAP
jgi:hypothetical protein